MHVLSAIHQYVAVNIWSEEGFRQSRSPSSTYFCPVLDLPLGISCRNHYQNGSIPIKAFCLWSSLWILLATPWIHPRADLIKSLNTCAGHENFIPTKFHKHPSSGSAVKADYVCSHIYNVVSLCYRTSWRMLMKLGRDEVLMVPYKCCCFRPDPPRGVSRVGQK